MPYPINGKMILSSLFEPPRQNPSVRVFAFATVVSRNVVGASESRFSLSDASSSTFVVALRIIVKGWLDDLRFRSRGIDWKERVEKPYTEQLSLGRKRLDTIETERYSCRQADMCAGNRFDPKILKDGPNVEFSLRVLSHCLCSNTNSRVYTRGWLMTCIHLRLDL